MIIVLYNDKKLTVCYYDENACYNEKQKICYYKKICYYDRLIIMLKAFL